MHTIDSPRFHPTAFKKTPTFKVVRERRENLKQEWRGGARVFKK